MSTQELSPEIEKIQETVVGMYSENPWPLNRRTDEEMGWRLKCLGIAPEDYQGKRCSIWAAALVSTLCGTPRTGRPV